MRKLEYNIRKLVVAIYIFKINVKGKMMKVYHTGSMYVVGDLYLQNNKENKTEK